MIFIKQKNKEKYYLKILDFNHSEGRKYNSYDFTLIKEYNWSAKLDLKELDKQII